ncbi:MAG: TetR/AcrR family transcriptional regulator [Chloroflexota bacterium]|nr:MAG: TetR family transcriptional regulator [Chloroflexota bacterium]
MSSKRQRLDPRVVRTRQMLRDAMMALIPVRGYEAITVQHLTNQAGLSRATFYLHYRDKEDLLQQIIHDVLQELETAPPLLPSSRGVEIYSLFVFLFEHVARHAEFYRVMLEERSLAPYLQQMQAHIEAIGMRWLSSAGGRVEDMLTPPDLFISFMSAAFLGVTRWWVSNQLRHPPEYMAAQFMRLTLGAVQTDFDVGELIAPVEDRLRQARRNN